MGLGKASLSRNAQSGEAEHQWTNRRPRSPNSIPLSLYNSPVTVGGGCVGGGDPPHSPPPTATRPSHNTIRCPRFTGAVAGRQSGAGRGAAHHPGANPGLALAQQLRRLPDDVVTDAPGKEVPFTSWLEDGLPRPLFSLRADHYAALLEYPHRPPGPAVAPVVRWPPASGLVRDQTDRQIVGWCVHRQTWLLWTAFFFWKRVKMAIFLGGGSPPNFG